MRQPSRIPFRQHHDALHCIHLQGLPFLTRRAYESMSSLPTVRPFFVYGTLMKNFRNYNAFLRGKAVDIVPASVTGFYLVHFNEGYPGMFFNGDNPDSKVLGELVYPKDTETWKSLQVSLDELEGYNPSDKEGRNNYYERVNLSCFNEDSKGMVDCDTYICKLDPLEGIRLNGNVVSWRDFMKERNMVGAGEDWAQKSGT